MEFVSFEIAKKLKEKGFKEPCFATYDNDGMLGYVYYQPQRIHAISFDDCLYYGNDVVVAPTISQVLKWLRNEKEIYCLPHFEQGIDMWLFCIERPLAGTEFAEYISESIYNTYEDAAIAGIEYVLDNLI